MWNTRFNFRFRIVVSNCVFAWLAHSWYWTMRYSNHFNVQFDADSSWKIVYSRNSVGKGGRVLSFLLSHFFWLIPPATGTCGTPRRFTRLLSVTSRLDRIQVNQTCEVGQYLLNESIRWTRNDKLIGTVSSRIRHVIALLVCSFMASQLAKQSERKYAKYHVKFLIVYPYELTDRLDIFGLVLGVSMGVRWCFLRHLADWNLSRSSI